MKQREKEEDRIKREEDKMRAKVVILRTRLESCNLVKASF